MSISKAEHIAVVGLAEKLKSYATLFKLKITLFVVISAVFGYFIGIENFSFVSLLWLTIGGFFITAASNAFNQIIERNHDGLMERTKNRP
ncbi:MAG TPA: UbiA family prenyltransferase, partial [Vicingus sp.]|nr:UbiA family prenyltransferase [Vicingus sp.]